ncbi:alpha-glucan family phosphorylase [Armatimonas sp.]|uniref:alpha-glucan family phosphorylase n=1 Tax=Armatimonas sp. TaxID=1872638 RepID=UPI00286BFB4B|nr:alpha-glucan family phosphorylase [Armatimonas sp.]
MPRTLHTYTVTPRLPERLAPLRELAYNLRWAWHPDTRALFVTLGGEPLWKECEHNPAKLLGMVPQATYDALSQSPEFLEKLDAVWADFSAYKNAPADPRWAGLGTVAYFSAEFGLTESLPIYSGGLGVLAGDHLKAASDINLPLVAIGFLYQNGYFRQSLNADGWQVERYPSNDFYTLPIEPTEKKIAVQFPGRIVHAAIWKAQVGRIPLYLLDTNLPENADADRHIAGNLYGGDQETRIQQELVLGVGGVQALADLGITPTVCHMNEGHSAFLSLERARQLRDKTDLSFSEATNATAAAHLFTTHTPVPAGFDIFPGELVWKYFGEFAPKLGISFEELLDRGRAPQMEPGKFNMAVLAFRHARYINGVSKLHGHVSREMAHPVWQEFPLDEVPIGSVTNGIHTPSFLSRQMAELLEAHDNNPLELPDEALWNIKQERREILVKWARTYQRKRAELRKASDREVDEADNILDPDVLTIGFARRFATYKRGDLLLREVERVKRLIAHADRPVQFVFAGKAHPRDDGGKELIRRIVQFSHDPQVRGRVVFLEDYDMAMARRLVQGVDVWLNNPRRPYEASGTSGMKVVMNGGLNCSILDGWWAEAYADNGSAVGWAIGQGEDYADLAYQDHVEAQAIYHLLEDEIAPLFYARDEFGIPRGWVAKMKQSMHKLGPVYDTRRMVTEYATTYYLPAAKRAAKLAENNFALTRELVVWKEKVRHEWPQVRLDSVTTDSDHLEAGQQATVRAALWLGETLLPGDVQVQLYTGPVDTDRNFLHAAGIPLTCEGKDGGAWIYTGHLPTEHSGQQGFSVRVLPYHPEAILPQELPLIVWE